MDAEAAEAAEALLADADRDAEAERAAAREEIRRAWHKADRERLLVEAETQRLQMLRQILAEQLAQVQTHLSLALRATGDGGEAEGGSDVKAGHAEPTAGAIETDGEGGPAVQTQQAVPPNTATAAE
jgi:hypothetical protein